MAIKANGVSITNFVQLLWNFIKVMPPDRISQNKLSYHPFSHTRVSQMIERYGNLTTKRKGNMRNVLMGKTEVTRNKIKTVGFIIRCKEVYVAWRQRLVCSWTSSRSWRRKGSCLDRRQGWRHHYLRTYLLTDTLNTKSHLNSSLTLKPNLEPSLYRKEIELSSDWRQF